ncbi:MAG: TolC family protein [Pseudomonadota bacterium]
MFIVSSSSKKQYPLLAGALALALLAVSGCTAPRALSEQELGDAARQRMELLDERRAQLADGLTLAEAMAWAMDNNLNMRAEALERAMADSNRKLAATSMLPGLTAQAGYRRRSNLFASSSSSILTGRTSLEPSTSSEREGVSASLEASWNMLDFSLAWLRARSEGDRANMAGESRRRMAHQVALDLVSAWERAAAFQRIRPELTAASAQIGAALRQTDRIAASRLRDPVEVLDYRSALLLVLKRLDGLVLQMDQAQDELARLLAIPAGTELRLDLQPFLPVDAIPAGDVRSWQYVALMSRPEIRQTLYARRLSDRSAVRRYVEQFPSLIFKFGSHYDSNDFLVNNSWQDASASLSLSIIRLASLPLQRRAAAVEKQQAETQAELQATAVLAQVALAGKALASARRQSCLSNALADTSNAKLELLDARARAAAVDELTMVRTRTDNLLLRVERDLAEADARRGMLMMAQSAGIGAMPESAFEVAGSARVEALSAWLRSGFAAHLKERLEKTRKDFAAGPGHASEQGNSGTADTPASVGNASASGAGPTGDTESRETSLHGTPPGDQTLCM